MAKDTKDKILSAALKLFTEKETSNVNIQEIADIAGVSRTNVNYHFKTKEQLHEEVVKFAVEQMLPPFKLLVKKEYNTEQRIFLFISKYVNVLREYPFLPSYLIYAINNNSLNTALIEHNVDLDSFYNKINSRIRRGTMIKLNPQHVLIFMLSLCSYPRIGQKLISLSAGIHTDVYDSFLLEQTNIMTDFVLRGLGLRPID